MYALNTHTNAYSLWGFSRESKYFIMFFKPELKLSKKNCKNWKVSVEKIHVFILFIISNNNFTICMYYLFITLKLA